MGLDVLHKLFNSKYQDIPKTDFEAYKYLLNKGLTEKMIKSVVEKNIKIPYYDLKKHGIDSSLIHHFNAKELKSRGVIPIENTEQGVRYVINELLSNQIKTYTSTLSQGVLNNSKSICSYFAFNFEIYDLINKLYDGEDLSDYQFEIHKSSQTEKKEESTVLKIVDDILYKGLDARSSDIHIEPLEYGMQVRYRVDGVLSIRDFFNYSKAQYSGIVNRLKIMSGLRIEERREGQDGRIPNKEYKNQLYDFRVSSMATIHGEKLVLRVLEKSSKIQTLKELGFSDHFINRIKKDINRPYGLILNSGATGSGKSTTLYSLLNELDCKTINVSAIEDPVEKAVQDVNQICVKTTGVGFYSHLRTLLRQDPNVIVVGEIRDNETANLTVEASLTGHLVISTVHTNTALETLERLFNMGIEAYQLAAALVGIASQRLVRILCEHCKEKRVIQLNEKKWIESLLVRLGVHSESEISEIVSNFQYVYESKGCSECRSIGFSGRTVVSEYLSVDKEIKEMISEGYTGKKILEKAIINDFVPIEIDALNKVLRGYTSIEEVMRLYQ